MFLLFLKRSDDVVAPLLICIVLCFCGLFVCVVSPLVEDRAMSPEFQMVHRPRLFPITDQFPLQRYCLRCSNVYSVCLSWKIYGQYTGQYFQLPRFIFRKVWVPVMYFCVCPIHCKVHWRVGRRIGQCRLISVQPLTWSITRAFSVSSALWVLEVLCCLYCHSFYQFDHCLHVAVDDCGRKLVTVASGVPQGSVWGQLLFFLYTLVLFSILKNKLIGFALDSTLIGVVPKVYRLKRGRCKLNAKKKIAHNDITWRATARKILKKINVLATRISLTLSI